MVVGGYEAAPMAVGDTATFGARLMAAFIDLLVAIVPMGIVASIAGGLLGDAVAPYASLVTWLAYLSICWNKFGATVGMRLLGLTVVARDGSPVTAQRALLRAVGYLGCMCTLGYGFWRMNANQHKQGWHDRLAGTFVIKGRASGTPSRPETVSSTIGDSPQAAGAAPRGWFQRFDDWMGQIATGRSVPTDTNPAESQAVAAIAELRDRIQHELDSRGLAAMDFAGRLERVHEWHIEFDSLVTRVREIQRQPESVAGAGIRDNRRRRRREQAIEAQIAAAHAVISQAALAVPVAERASSGLVRALNDAVPGLNPTCTVMETTAYISMPAPENTVPTTARQERQTKQGTSVTERQRSIQEVNRDYKDLVARRARRATALAFESVPGLEVVAVSLLQPAIHTTLGHHYQRCILAVNCDRDTWSKIIHANVTDENALRNFSLRLRYDSDFVLQEVAPITLPAGGEPNDRAVMMREMDPLAFEALTKDLLQKMGFQAQLTKASHDGGIDVEAFNPEPIIGGKVVVQCKRYANTIGSPIVRDLYGSMMAVGATKGILMTTSDYSPDARMFAEGKPLELINGEQLVLLLRKHGFNVA